MSAIFFRRSQFETVYRSYGARGQISEIYCKIIYYKMNQFEVRSNLRIWKSIILENDFQSSGIIATKYRNMKLCWNPQIYRSMRFSDPSLKNNCLCNLVFSKKSCTYLLEQLTRCLYEKWILFSVKSTIGNSWQHLVTSRLNQLKPLYKS